MAKMVSTEDIVFPDVPFDLKKHLCILVRRGSEAHGTYRPPTEPDAIDDKDLFGVVMPPRRFYFGLDSWKHAEEINDPWDVVLTEIRAFVQLLVVQNPNILAVVWAEDADYLHINDVGRLLLSHRTLFRSKSAFDRFVGYANSQLRRMTHTQFRGYMGAKRKSLVEKFGYDTKNASHLIRLLRQGIEFLLTGRLNVRRYDSDELVSIKRGEWSLQRVLEESEILFKRAEDARDRSTLPEYVDLEQVDDLLRRIFAVSKSSW